MPRPILHTCIMYNCICIHTNHHSSQALQQNHWIMYTWNDRPPEFFTLDFSVPPPLLPIAHHHQHRIPPRITIRAKISPFQELLLPPNWFPPWIFDLNDSSLDPRWFNGNRTLTLFGLPLRLDVALVNKLFHAPCFEWRFWSFEIRCNYFIRLKSADKAMQHYAQNVILDLKVCSLPFYGSKYHFRVQSTILGLKVPFRVQSRPIMLVFKVPCYGSNFKVPFRVLMIKSTILELNLPLWSLKVPFYDSKDHFRGQSIIYYLKFPLGT